MVAAFLVICWLGVLCCVVCWLLVNSVVVYSSLLCSLFVVVDWLRMCGFMMFADWAGC